MKHSKILALVLLLTFLLETSSFAAVSDYPSITWPQISVNYWSGEKSVMLTLEGVVGKKIDEDSVMLADLPITVIGLYDGEEVWANGDGTYTVWTPDDGEVVVTRDELVENFADGSVQLIPVVDGATLKITNLTDSEHLSFFPGGYTFVDEEKTILAIAMGQMGSYTSDTSEIFRFSEGSTYGMNDFALDFPFSLIIDGTEVSYTIITVSEEKAAELMATLSEVENTTEGEAAVEESQENEAVVEESQENEAVVEDTQENETAVEDTQQNETVVDDTVYTAEPTTTKFELNGNPVSMEAYLIGNNNYVKLRDIAMAVNGTSKQFNVTWDQEKKAINMFSNTPYEPVGGEMAAGDGTSKTAEANVAKIYKDNEEITLTAYTIDGYNYFKLRDIAKAFDIGVTWDGETLTARIDTESSYAE